MWLVCRFRPRSCWILGQGHDPFPFFGRGLFVIIVVRRGGFSFCWDCYLVCEAEDSDFVRREDTQSLDGCCERMVLLVGHIIMTKGKRNFYQRVLKAGSIERWWDRDVDAIFDAEEFRLFNVVVLCGLLEERFDFWRNGRPVLSRGFS